MFSDKGIVLTSKVEEGVVWTQDSVHIPVPSEGRQEVQLTQEIKSSFHTDKYIGFVLLNEEKSGYEVRLYNRAGKQVMNYKIDGEYSNVQMIKDEIIMYEGSRCCIITKTGIPRFQGDLKVDIMSVVPGFGLNKYYVMSANELRVIYLTI